MSLRHKQKRRLRYYFQRKRCMRCGEPGGECRLEAWNEQPDEILCSDHAAEAGYCRGCGMFWAGITSFDMRASGLCDHCHADVAADFAETSDDEDYGGYEE